MSRAKEFYRTYRADNKISPLTMELQRLIMEHTTESCERPSVFEFGAGTGKNLRELHTLGHVTFGLDVSPLNVMEAYLTNDLPFVALGDESHLGFLNKFDIVFTCSVLDHIEHIGGIIMELKRIANKAIYIAETNDKIGEFYYPHVYETYDFKRLPFEWKSLGDGAVYHIWKFTPEPCVQ